MPQNKKDIKVLECVQRRVNKMVKDLEGKPYGQQRSVDLLTLEKRRATGNLVCSLQLPHEGKRRNRN